MPRHLLMRLEAPLMSFGTTAVDHRRPVQPWPAASMLTGLLANALGWQRTHATQLDRLQARLRWAARIDRAGVMLEDFQTALLSQRDEGWTSRGVVEKRGGSSTTFDSPHLRYRDYRADASVLVALRLEPADEVPTVADLAEALERPARPLFIGRKGCLPAARIGCGLVDADDAMHAVCVAPALAGDGANPQDAAIYVGEGGCTNTVGLRVHWASDERSFSADVHAGRQRVYERPARGWA